MTSVNYSKSLQTPVGKQPEKKYSWRIWRLLLLIPVWVYAVFLAVQLALMMVVHGLVFIGVPFGVMNQVLLNTILSVVVYSLTVAVVIFVPWLIARRKTSLKLLGIDDWPTILELVISPLVYVAYFLISATLVAISVKFFSVDITQTQSTPFSQSILISHWQFILAFLVLVVLAPVAEELLFRGYLYGKLRNNFSVWLAVLVTSLTFGVAHLWGGEHLQWAVAVDTFALSLAMSVAREYTGALWVPIMVHMIKNGIAFYMLYLNPGLIDQIKAACLPFL